jgi:adenosylmethionine-8-amino-7-oxononanoate aminotransferase
MDSATSHAFQTASLSAKDRMFIWHPFTQFKTASLPIPIVRGEGVYLYAEDGSSYIDAISSWWVNLHGHGHPELIEALYKQAHQLEHVMFTDFTHRPAVELAESLLQCFQGHFGRVFYSDNGSTAVETALKIVFQYWHNVGTPRTTLVCFKQAYHGDTFGAMAVAGKNDIHLPFWPFLFDVIAIEPPRIGEEKIFLDAFKQLHQQQPLAGFIFEPLIQGVGGMLTYSLQGLNEIIAYCQTQHILTIADEVMTGFGRTGSLFVIDQLMYKPDLICLSKGITGGFLPLGATLCTEKIFEAFLDRSHSKALLHGHSYCANPIACQVALTNIALLKRPLCQLQRQEIEKHHYIFCKKWVNHSQVKRCEVIGTILVLEYQTVESQGYFHSMRQNLQKLFLEERMLLRPFGNMVHVMPPYCITEGELHKIYQVLEKSLC